MFEIDSNGIISITRGDSVRLPLFINQGNEISMIRYSMKDNNNCELYFAITEPNQPFENAVVKKKYTKNDANDDGDVVITINHNDTKELRPGLYFYTIKAKVNTDSEGEFDVITIIPLTQFLIQE